MPFPNVAEINIIFKEYITSLQHQSNFKKTITSFVNTARSYLPSLGKNEYIQKDLETTKKDKILNFQQEYHNASQLSEDQLLSFWMKHLGMLREEFKSIKEAEIYNEAKYGIAIQTVRNLICEALYSSSLFQLQLHKYLEDLEVVEKNILDKEKAGYKPTSLEIETRNNLLMELVHLFHYESVVKASQLGILAGYDKPLKDQFLNSTVYNLVISKNAEIHPEIPWVFQPNLPKLYKFRLEHHRFPTCRQEWDDWKAKEMLSGRLNTFASSSTSSSPYPDQAPLTPMSNASLSSNNSTTTAAPDSQPSASGLLLLTSPANVTSTQTIVTMLGTNTPKLTPPLASTNKPAPQESSTSATTINPGETTTVLPKSAAISLALNKLRLTGKPRKLKRNEFKRHPERLEELGIVVDTAEPTSPHSLP